MSSRFISNLGALLIGSGILVFAFAYGRGVSDWVALGGGVGAIVLAMHSFASVDQGVHQRVADVLNALFGAWAIVAARVMNYQPRWLVFGAGLALAVLGAVGLVVRELSLSRGSQVGSSRIGPDQLAHLSAVQRDARVHS